MSTPNEPSNPEDPKRLSVDEDAEAVRLGRFLPLGMLVGGLFGGLVGWLLHRPGICIPVGIALGILVAGTLPLRQGRR